MYNGVSDCFVREVDLYYRYGRPVEFVSEQIRCRARRLRRIAVAQADGGGNYDCGENRGTLSLRARGTPSSPSSSFTSEKASAIVRAAGKPEPGLGQ